MKDFIARLFKKKNPESVETEAPKIPESAPAAKTEEKPVTPVVLPEVKESLKSAQAEAKPASAPVLKPLYDTKDETPAAEPAASAEAAQSPHQHLPFEGELQEAIKAIVIELVDVYPQTFEEWEDGFRRDDNPEQEIAAWRHLATVLKTLSAQFDFHAAERRECFKILLACFTGSRDTVHDREKPSLLSEDQFQQTIIYFYEGGY